MPREAWPVALGMVPLGLAFGLLLTQLGFAWWWAPIFSFVIYAGSMEFLALTLVTGGVGPVSAALYGLLVNFRHVFYALNYPLDKVRGWLGKGYGMYALTDETYAILAARYGGRGMGNSDGDVSEDAGWTGRQILGIQVVLQAGWVGGGLLGALGGEALPFQVKGMEFALTALFTVLLIEAFNNYKDVSLPLTAVACGALGWLISVENMLMIGMSVYCAVLVVRHIFPRLDELMRWQVGVPQVARRMSALGPHAEGLESHVEGGDQR